ncbi:glutaredoxin [Sulfurifustis variabilis]|uniref:Glutaredoxin n=1 Tax=Sulfurifustis variabilis TaxID=1675686 RepID=A0A1B4UZX5_9GAMM|nr:glutaredoxin family protein [Sulfurifustis variabilis]BAU46716.1 glutaredoxin [Sulfurifustis variabilis]
MHLRALLILLAALGAASAAHGQKLYKWVDKEGRVSYHDQPPPTDDYRVEEKQLGGRARVAVDNEAMAAAAEKSPVVLYAAPRCGSCDTARTYLQKRGIPFTEKNVEGDRKLQEELIKQAGGLAVPTITVGSKVMRGYLESLLEGELDQAGYPRPEEPEKADAADAAETQEAAKADQ